MLLHNTALVTRSLPRCLAILAVLSLLFLTATGWTQHVPLKTYDRAQGLDGFDVNCMFQDREGTLWVGTEEGLYRYNGKRFQEFSVADGLADSNITRIVEDAKGVLWIATGAGISVLKDGHFYSVPSSYLRGGARINSSMTPYQDGILVVSTQTLWFVKFMPKATPEQGLSWSVTPFEREKIPEKQARSVFQDRFGVLWIGCGDNLCRMVGNRLEQWQQTPSLPEERWSRIIPSQDGGLWLRGASHIYFLPRNGKRFENRTGALGSRLSVDMGASILEDSPGHFLVAAKQGVVCWANGSWRDCANFDHQNKTKALPLLLDSEGNLWLSVPGHGIQRALGYGRWESWTEDEGITGGLIFGVVHDRKDRIWVAAQEGLFLSLPPHTSFHAFSQKLTKTDHMRAVREASDGSIWASSRNGFLLHIDPENLQAVTVPVTSPDGYAWQFDEAPNGNLWVITDAGLVVLHKSGSRFVIDNDFRLPADSGTPVNVVKDKHGHMLVLTSSYLLKYSNGEWLSFLLPEEWQQSELSHMTVDVEGGIWLGGDRLLLRIELDGTTLRKSRIYTPSEYGTGSITFIGKDVPGNIWVGGNNGVARYDGITWRRYSSDDGLLWDDTDAFAFSADSDGSVWLGTTDGLSHFRNTNKESGAGALSTPDLEARIGNQPVPLATPAVFSWRESTLIASLASRTFVHESAIKFYYRLVGFESKWTLSHDGEIRYPNLPPGSYVLEVYSEDEELHRSSEIRSLPFKIFAPWWKRLPFELAVGTLFASALVVLIRLLVHYLLKRKLLEEQATRDGLTKIWNRNAGLERLQRDLLREQRLHGSVALILMDVDYFKLINDTYGHLIGDLVLQEIALRLQASVRAHDTVARYGGEEFLLILPHIGEEAVLERVHQLQEAIRSTPISAGPHAVRVTGSFGVVFLERVEDSAPEFLLGRADQLLYAAKHAGRNRMEFSCQTTPLKLSVAESITPTHTPLLG